jgi:S1-C subfamily serine protease
MSRVSHRYQPEPAFSGVFSGTFLSIVLLALLGALGLRGLRARGGLDDDARPRAVQQRGELLPEERATIALFESASPAVVFILSRSELFGLWRNRQQEVVEGSGSGFLWDQEGHVVTNMHVVRGATRFFVRFHDGSSYEATAVGQAPDYDLAVLAVGAPREKLATLPVGRSSELRVGQRAFAIGYPFGGDQTLTTGVVSGLGREIDSQSGFKIHGVIQTDAAINPGNSGGPLLDSAGRLIGVNTAIATPSGANAGVGFAVPVDTVNRIVPRILREGNVERAVLGIIVGQDFLARDEGLTGAVVGSVTEDGPASRAGFEGASVSREGEVTLGDLILAIDEHEIRGEEDLFQALEGYRVGDEVRVKVSRPARSGRRTEELVVRLGSPPRLR